MCPEGGEIIASYEHIIHVLRGLAFFKKDDVLEDGHTFRDSSDGWPLQGIWADYTQDEHDTLVAAGPVSHRVEQRLVMKVQPLESLPRGNGNDRGTVWPLQFPSLDGLVFKNVFISAKSIVFDFTTCVLDVRRLHLRFIVLNPEQMHYLTHTSVQIYPKRVWEERVIDVPALVRLFLFTLCAANASLQPEKRAYKIIMGLEFEHYVIAFLSKDLVAKVRLVCCSSLHQFFTVMSSPNGERNAQHPRPRSFQAGRQTWIRCPCRRSGGRWSQNWSERSSSTRRSLARRSTISGSLLSSLFATHAASTSLASGYLL